MSKKYHVAHNTMREAVDMALKKTYVPSSVKSKTAVVEKGGSFRSSRSSTRSSHISPSRKANSTKRK